MDTSALKPQSEICHLFSLKTAEPKTAELGYYIIVSKAWLQLSLRRTNQSCGQWAELRSFPFTNVLTPFWNASIFSFMKNIECAGLGFQFGWPTSAINRNGARQRYCYHNAHIIFNKDLYNYHR